MTDGAKPLSRKERRALEAQRHAAGDPTQALPVAPESDDLKNLTRRDRRRLERLERPMEIWTAEEEMIATGQIPAMTPEMIAEQERLARERAAQADAEARAAAEALGIPTPSRGASQVPDAVAEPVSEVPDAVAEPVSEVPDAEVEPVSEVPDAEVEPVSEVPDAVAEPVSEVPDAVDEPVAKAPAADVVAAPVEVADVVAEAAAAEVPAEEPTAAVVEPSLEWTAPAGEAEPAAETPAEPAAEIPAEPVADEIPEQFRDWFPPGSLQARAFEAKTVEPLPAVSPDAADEIRRLTQEAMAGITRATTGAVPQVTAEPENEPVAEPAAEHATDVPYQPAAIVPEPGHDVGQVAEQTADVPALPEGVDVEELWAASADVESLPDAETPVQLEDVPFVGDFSTEVPDGTQDAEVAPALWNTLVPASLASQRPLAEDAAGAAQARAQTLPAPPTIWDTHPLAQVDAAPVRELEPQAPAQDLPRPDLSALLPTSAEPVAPATAAIPDVSETSGTKPEPLPPAAAGARHFRWAHLAVIGAIAFLLGVLAWNIARSGS